MIDFGFQNIFLFYTSPEFFGIIGIFSFLIFLSVWMRYFPEGNVTLFFELIYEKIYLFFDEVLSQDTARSTIEGVTALFCLLFSINIFGLFLDILSPIFGYTASGDFLLSQYISSSSSQLNFTLALACISVLGILLIQFQSYGGKGFFLNYIPLKGKGYIGIPSLNKKSFFSIIGFTVAKIADIILSFFLAFLDIVGICAKVISLSFRLFGNMLSGSILGAMLLLSLGDLSKNLTSFFGGIQFPILIPLIFYIQSFFVAFLQAFVFALLVAIFIRVSVKETS